MIPLIPSLEQLIFFWRGIAKDEREMEQRQALSLNRPYRSSGKPERWERCAQQLEMVLQGKDPYPDV